MSGEIFQPLESLMEAEGARPDPLHCHLCNEKYEEPCVLQCYHTFCAGCLRGRAQDGVMSCPFCGCCSTTEVSTDLPPKDSLMSFLVKSSVEDTANCANCDKTSSTMFFCNTCNQPLCNTCKEDTHKARMFASHTIVTLNKRTKEQHKKCAKHREDYIMFSVDKSKLLCIKCFKDMAKEDRADCVDLETAYNQGCQQLQEQSLTIRELQSSVHDAIILFQALTQEVKTNAEEERKAISALYDLMQEKMEATKADLLREVERQYHDKEKAFKATLPILAALLPTLHTMQAICALYSNNANIYEFLDLSASLMERLSSVVDHPHQLSPQQSSKICSNFQEEFAKCLQPLLQDGCGDASCRTSHTCNARSKDSSPYVSHQMAHQFSQQATYIQMHRRMVKEAGNRQNILMGSGPFIEHCKAFEANHKLIHRRIQKMKEQVQELHRDITRRRCLSKNEAVSDILDECSQVDVQINTQMATLEHMKIVFQRLWQDTLERVSREQGLYQTQLSEMRRLKQENGHLETIARQIAPFITSIATVTQRIDPRRESIPEDDLHAVMEQISTILPVAPLRVDAIRISEEEREAALQLAQCKPSQLADDLIRTKEMLRSHKSPTTELKHHGGITNNKDADDRTSASEDDVRLSGEMTLGGKQCSVECNTKSLQIFEEEDTQTKHSDGVLGPDSQTRVEAIQGNDNQDDPYRDSTNHKVDDGKINATVQCNKEWRTNRLGSKLKAEAVVSPCATTTEELTNLPQKSGEGCQRVASLSELNRYSCNLEGMPCINRAMLNKHTASARTESFRLKVNQDKKKLPQRIKVTVTVDENNLMVDGQNS